MRLRPPHAGAAGPGANPTGGDGPATDQVAKRRAGRPLTCRGRAPRRPSGPRRRRPPCQPSAVALEADSAPVLVELVLGDQLAVGLDVLDTELPGHVSARRRSC